MENLKDPYLPILKFLTHIRLLKTLNCFYILHIFLFLRQNFRLHLTPDVRCIWAIIDIFRRGWGDKVDPILGMAGVFKCLDSFSHLEFLHKPVGFVAIQA